jgi:glutathione synthase/RimK-type ligase-like ATP-grasp enzyme
MIAIHNNKSGFTDRWVNYCRTQNIPFKFVDCYSNDIIQQLESCDALMWHFLHLSPKDFLFAKQLLFSLEQSGKRVFPDFNTMWHFDDKTGQKYLLESLSIPFVNTWVFFDPREAKQWINQVSFPKVFKLRGGAGSVNVKLVKSHKQANFLARKAFRKGFFHDSQLPVSDIINKVKRGVLPFSAILKGMIRQIYPTKFAKYYGKEIGYIYFQDFIPNNDHDIRVIIIDEKAFAIKRLVRENDFRASGSGKILYDKYHFGDEIISLAFTIHEKLKSQCTAMDFVFDKGEPKVVEISYGFSPYGYDACPGYWDRELNWHEGKFDPYGWMIELVLKTT